MATRAVTYQKLPGRGIGLAGWSRLYLGPDHLLQVASTGYQETYKRFHYGDIQAIFLQRTALFLVLNWTFGVLTVLCLGGWLLAALSGLARQGPALWVLMGIATALCAGPLLLNLLLGPTCVCYLRTAVQIERLAAIRRVRRAERALDRLRPLIEAIQGLVPTDTAAPVRPSAVESTPPARTAP